MSFGYKLGRKPAKHNLRLPLLSAYTANLPAPPVACNWASDCAFQMFDNDTLGDCTAAALANQEIAWANACGKVSPITEKQVVQFYSATTGYDPANPASDEGGVESDILAQWMKTPGLLGGRNLAAYAAFRPQTVGSLKDAIWITGGAYLGIDLPETIQTQGMLWDVPAGGAVGPGAVGSLGGHAVCALGYDSRVVYFASWGALYAMTWDFYTTYTEEAYALVSPDFLLANNLTPNGFDLATLQADAQALIAAV
jgi:hypothetical protein